MIRVENKEFVFTRPNLPQPLYRRQAIFGHVCPRCEKLIQGLFLHEPDQTVAPQWRGKGGHPQEINLKSFAEGTVDFMVPPDYTWSMIQLAGGPVGQFFFDLHHFTQAGFRYHGRCKYTRGIFMFEDNVHREALRLMGALKLLYGTEEPKWVEVRARLAQDAGAAENIIEQIKAKAGQAPEVVGKGRPTVLISKEDWDYSTFNGLVDGLLAPAA
jgi:hypothetical protein